MTPSDFEGEDTGSLLLRETIQVLREGASESVELRQELRTAVLAMQGAVASAVVEMASTRTEMLRVCTMGAEAMARKAAERDAERSRWADMKLGASAVWKTFAAPVGIILGAVAAYLAAKIGAGH